jgi:ParB family chromosome partitioning protein
MGHARALLALPTLKQIELAREAVARGLSVRQVEQRVNALLASPARRSGRRVDRDVARLEEEIAQRVGTRVEIRSRKGGAGKLVLYYSNHAQLDALIERLRRGG